MKKIAIVEFGNQVKFKGEPNEIFNITTKNSELEGNAECHWYYFKERDEGELNELAQFYDLIFELKGGKLCFPEKGE